jgi:hypothetical protein
MITDVVEVCYTVWVMDLQPFLLNGCLSKMKLEFYSEVIILVDTVEFIIFLKPCRITDVVEVCYTVWVMDLKL